MNRSPAVALILAALATVASAAPADRPAIRWIPDPSATNKFLVEVSGLPVAFLERLRSASPSPTKWQKLLAVRPEQGDLFAEIGLPPMLGAYRVESNALRFEPRFPLEPGLLYRATFSGAANGEILSSTFRVPARPLAPATVVAQIYPSASTVPENLLKFYVHFSAPMSRGQIYEHIHLRNSAGREIELPFLEIDEELWDPSMTRLTLFIDPGRIKREVRPLEEIGPSLERGKSYTLAIDRAWKDAAGNPLKEPFAKTFKVGPPERESINTAAWRIVPPPDGTRQPLTVTFPKPMDHALAQRVLHVTTAAGVAVEGQAALEDQERRWVFTPAREWPRGPHRLVVQTTLEDLAGNNIGKPFEVDLFEGVQRRVTNSVVKFSFEIGQGPL